MAFLSEGAVWEPGIYRLETTDPVIGGESGKSNVQGKQLANRTSYLKAIVDQLVQTAFTETAQNGGSILERLSTSGNLNDLLSQGLFYCYEATNAPATIGFCWVGYDAPECSQIFHCTTAGSHYMYMRTHVGTGWTAWKRVLDSDDYDVITSSISNSNDNLTAFKTSLAGMISAMPYQATFTGNWLECNGQAVSRTTYSKLFTKIGTTWGSGDNSTTFNLPDLRGEFIRGWDNGRGIDSGRLFKSLQLDENKSHYHTTEFGGNTPQSSSPGGSLAGAGETLFSFNTSTSGTESRPRNIALIYCIFTGN